jgi:diguanylate cyclase (GGDEF)-like protein/PAS domain S-box-containing protein
MGEELEAEFQMLNSLAPTVGFFTYGEYFHSSKINEVLNITTTFLALSEDAHNKSKKIITTKKYTNNRVLKALTHLTKEIEFKNQELSRLNQMISKSALYSTSDRNGNILTVSNAYIEFLRLKKKDVIGKNHNIFRHPDTPDSFYTNMWKYLDENKRFIDSLKNRRADGSEYWIRIIIDPIFNEKNEKIGYSSYREDITDQKNFEYLSSHDSLTKLYNRAEFTNRIKNKIKSAQRYKEEFGFIVLDIDHFKRVNDTYGHKIGDNVLIRLSEFLSNHLRDDDFLARWGGEEFVIIANYATIENLILLIKKLQKEIAKVSFDPVEKITLSFGLSVYKDGDTKESLFERTDKALYMAKENGRDRYEVLL